MRNASRYQKMLAVLRFAAMGVLNAVGGLVRRWPRLVALNGEPGTVAILTTPDSRDGDRALRADRYPDG
jgi:hypothetical protein